MRWVLLPPPPCFSGAVSFGLPTELLPLVRAAFAAATLRSLESKWRTWLAFCSEAKIKALKPTPTQICQFINFLMHHRLSRQSNLQAYISSIATLLRLSDSPVTIDSGLVRLALRGAKRLLAAIPVRRKAALGPSHLLRLRRCLQLQTGLGAALWSLILAGWWAMLRAANLCSLSQANVGTAVLISDLRLGLKEAWISVRLSKTNQFGERRHVVLLPCICKSATAPLCPLCALHHHFSRNSLDIAPPSQPLFSTLQSAGSWMSLTAAHVQRELSQLFHQAGLPRNRFSMHSLRRGGATFARRSGIAIEDIKAIGDWKSDAVHLYAGQQPQVASWAVCRIGAAVQAAF
ncbi:hypothetical protein BOX15_Mlig005905g1 [Macrostomum lignano]|uniref:Tyr recombinase domain-containing protein n=1 Tax=Macrostomum lignano TaxID=282301 RepID=A0A267GGL2_9PLAT|nr:hypothetical protein BOX15_Mlig005905g1 [Macrostomum lignano]